MRRAQSSIACLTGILGGVLLCALNAHAVTITENMNIGSGSYFNGEIIDVENGVNGPTTVEIVAGGSVKGFDLFGSSEIILDGGAITFLSRLDDSSKFIFRGGTFGCLDSTCQVIDYDALLTAQDSSELHFFGGSFDDVIRLRDDARHIFTGEISCSPNLMARSRSAGNLPRAKNS